MALHLGVGTVLPYVEDEFRVGDVALRIHCLHRFVGTALDGDGLVVDDRHFLYFVLIAKILAGDAPLRVAVPARPEDVVPARFRRVIGQGRVSGAASSATPPPRGRPPTPG